jgi:hypothetical protein
VAKSRWGTPISVDLADAVGEGKFASCILDSSLQAQSARFVTNDQGRI